GPERSIPLSVEVNLPVSGVNRRVAGALGRDPTTGKTYRLHRGRIGGGTKGIGSDLFWQRFRGGVQLRDESGGEPVRVAVVAELGAPTAVRDIAACVHQVAIIKQAGRGWRVRSGPAFAGVQGRTAEPGLRPLPHRRGSASGILQQAPAIWRSSQPPAPPPKPGHRELVAGAGCGDEEEAFFGVFVGAAAGFVEVDR